MIRVVNIKGGKSAMAELIQIQCQPVSKSYFDFKRTYGQTLTVV